MNAVVRKLKEEPTVLVMITQAVLGLLVALNVIGFTDVQTGAVLAVVAAISGLIISLSVRPFEWTFITGLVQAAIVAAIEFGADITDEQIGAVYTAVVVLGIAVRWLVTPEIKLPPDPESARSLVRNE